MCRVPDYSIEFEMISELGKYYKGAYPIPSLMELTMSEFLSWYKLHEIEIIEDGIIKDLVQKDKPIPSAKRLRRMVDKKIEERKQELVG